MLAAKFLSAVRIETSNQRRISSMRVRGPPTQRLGSSFQKFNHASMAEDARDRSKSVPQNIGADSPGFYGL